MLLDINNMFAVKQDLTAVAVGTALSTRSVDLGPTGTIPSMFQAPLQANLRDPGKGQPVMCLIQVVTTFTTAAGGTLKVELVMADDAVLVTNLTSLEMSAVFAAATLVAGFKVPIAAALPPGVTQRFLGLRYTIGTGVFTAGQISAGLLFDKQTSFT